MSTPEVMRSRVASRVAEDLCCFKCGSEDITLIAHREAFTDDTERVFVTCMDCGEEAEGRDENEARAEWETGR